jgi:arylsulfotransferase ASST
MGRSPRYAGLRTLVRVAGPAFTVTIFALAPSARAVSPAVSVFPSPGTKYNQPQTQITFRGVPASPIGQVTVLGSKSGTHAGTIEADSDGNGGSFLPSKPFAPGETVTVTTALNILHAKNGEFSFGIANPAGPIPYGPLPVVPAARGGVQTYRTAPGLAPAAVDVTTGNAPPSQGDMFVAPESGPKQNGPMILDASGNLVWFLPYPVRENRLVTDFRVQQLHGQRVLTWWRGNTNAGYGRGVGVIYNSQYQPVATVKAANGLSMDKHEFLITNQGNAYFLAAWPLRVSSSRKPLIDCVIQRVDITTGLVLFQWDALAHVPLRQSYATGHGAGDTFDPYHANSISLDSDGNLVVSMRNTSAVYKINQQTGDIIWTLGGKASSFRMGAGTTTSGQHNAVVERGEQLTIFDNDGGLPRVKPDSRGIRVALDIQKKAVRMIKQYHHSPPIPSNFEGSLQSLSHGDVFIGWGQQPYFSEDNGAGQQIFDAHFAEPTFTYRAYRLPWSGQPPVSQLGAALSTAGDGVVEVYASWNGATDIASWRVLGGQSPTAQAPLGSQAKRHFETAIAVHSQLPYYALQALGTSGNVLGTSRVLSTPPHIALFGSSAFVATGGTGGVPVACYEPQQCRITTTVSAGVTQIARTAAQTLPPDRGGILHFRLSRAGRTMLALARANRLPVRVTARDASGATATSVLDLISFRTRGTGPHRSATSSSTLQIMGTTGFVSASGAGRILAGCMTMTSPCRTAAILTVGKTVIARTGPEFLGANALGYLSFSLNPAGRTLLAHATGNQLAALVTITDQTASATADIALIAFR